MENKGRGSAGCGSGSSDVRSGPAARSWLAAALLLASCTSGGRRRDGQFARERRRSSTSAAPTRPGRGTGAIWRWATRCRSDSGAGCRPSTGTRPTSSAIRSWSARTWAGRHQRDVPGGDDGQLPGRHGAEQRLREPGRVGQRVPATISRSTSPTTRRTRRSWRSRWRRSRRTDDVRLITVQIGANDGFVCQSTTADHCQAPAECRGDGQTIQTNLGKIRQRCGARGTTTARSWSSTTTRWTTASPAGERAPAC